MSNDFLIGFDTSIDRNRVCEQVADRLESQLRAGMLKPGDKLPSERELAALFDVSRTIIREALKLLEARGLLQTRTGQGVFVRMPDARAVTRTLEIYLHLQYPPESDTLEIDQLRRILESGIAAAAAQYATPEDIAHLQSLIDQLRLHEGSASEAGKLDLEFHLFLAEATHNRMLVLVLTPLVEHLRVHFQTVWTRYTGSTALIHDQHQAVVDAIATHDSQAASRAMDSHLDYAHQVIAQNFEAKS